MQRRAERQTGQNRLRKPLAALGFWRLLGRPQACLSALLVMSGCLGETPSRAELLDRLDAYLNVADGAGLEAGDSDAAEDAAITDAVSPPDGDALADTPEDAAPDTPVDADAADVTGDDATDATPDVVLTCTTTPAAAGCACKENSKCGSGVCQTTADNLRLCATSCSPSAPCSDPETVCAPVDVSPTASVHVCVPKWQTLCDPCHTTTQCKHEGAPGAACVDFGPPGAYCGTPCVSDADCNHLDPAHPFSCRIVTTAEGGQDKQCVPASPTGVGFGECACSPLASTKELTTACFLPSYDKTTGTLVGKCNGQRACDAGVLTACSAPKPGDEVCDKVDNDCDGLVDEGTCDDGLVCTADLCAGPANCTHTTLDGNACEDGSFCTLNDVCVGDTCTGTAKVCPGATCIATVCDPVDGQCESAIKQDTTPCDDGNACTTGDICLSGNCSGAGLVCDDTNPCTNDSCDPKGGCAHDPNSALCNDNNACTEFDQCATGKCAGVAKAGSCDDGNVCTDDTCDNVSGCVHLPNQATCTDGNSCTVDDACADGKCIPGLNECACNQDVDCAAREDGNLCNGTLYCNTDAIPFQCDVKPSTIVQCTPPNSPCQTVACEPTTGKCAVQNVPDGLSCDADGNVCTVGDACWSGACTPGPTVACDDGNVCTDDSCDPGVGCIKTANMAPCSDGNGCTTSDVCQGGACLSGMPVACPSLGPCVANTCEPATGNCVPSNTTSACDDGDPCTQGDTCKGGSCASGVPNPCPSGSKCATGSCDALTGNCTFKTVTCDDGNLCTIDACDPVAGCVFSPKPCDDANACTKDACDISTGACNYTPFGCDDNNFCTADSCNPATGCVYTAIAEGTVCSTNNQICVGTKCLTPFAMPTTYGSGIGAGASHTCVRTWSGGAACWGSDQQGQLGDGANKLQTVPVVVTGLTGVVDVDAGTAFSAAIAGANTRVRTWGAGSSGQLGNGGSVASNVVVDVSTTGTGTANAMRLSTGGTFACGLFSTGKVWCWGDNSHQQLGQGVGGVLTSKSTTPVQVSVNGNAQVSAIAAGTAHACAVSGGKVYCWGNNGNGQCGQSGTSDVNSPSAVGSLVNITALAAGDDFTCALGSGGVWCWGANGRGQLATGSFDNGGWTPVAVSLSAATDLSAGLQHACARTGTGAIQCWGRNDAGQLGNGAQTDSATPILVPGIPNTWKLACGDTHTCAIRTDGSVWCWGSNAAGSLGMNNGNTQPVLTPSLVYGTAPK